MSTGLKFYSQKDPHLPYFKRWMWLRKLYSLLFFILNFQAVLYPQNLKFEHLSLEDGLSQAFIRCILQDYRGFMWFGTGDGLNKYDGYRFIVYKDDPNNPQSLSANNAASIYEDQSGTLWIGTQASGLNRFDREKGTFTNFQHDPNNPQSLSDNYVFSIYEDRSGMLWIGTWDGGLNRFDRAKETFTHFQHDPNNSYSLSNNRVYSIYEDRSGVLWIGTGAGLNRFDRANKTFTHYQHDPNNPGSLSHNRAWVIYEDQADVLWIGTYGGGLNRFDRITETFTHFKYDPDNPHSLNSNAVLTIYEDHSGALWLGTHGGGLNRFDRTNEVFTHIKHDPNNPHSLSGEHVAQLYEDQSGVLWIGTWDGGLNRLDLSEQRFTHYQHIPNNPQSLSEKTVFSIYEDRLRMLWIGTRGGLDRFDRPNETFTHYQYDPDNPHSLSDNTVYAIYEDRAGVLWVGTYGGLNRFDRATETFTHFKHDPDNPHSLSDEPVRLIYEDQSGVLWIGTYGGGLNRFDRFTETFTHFNHDPNNPNSLSDDRIYSIYEEQSGVLWIATHGGLNRFDRETETFKQYLHDPNKPHSLSNNLVNAIHEDGSGVLWIGTYGGGLNRFDRKTETFKHFREKEGLPNDVVYGILENDQGYLWMSTHKGLAKFDPNPPQSPLTKGGSRFKNYDVYDGLQSNEFNAGAYFKSSSGEMFFGGINGFNAFYPDRIKDDPYIPPIVITDFQVFNEPVSIFKGDSSEEKPDSLFLDKHISETDEITLSYKESVFSFEFAALHYASPEKNQYAYMMEGFDEDWLYSGTRRVATYTNLDPGAYVFRVKGSNNDGVWNEQGTSIKITITPPWWKTWWAYTLYALTIIALLYSVRRFELKGMRLRDQLKLKQVEAEKLQEIDQMKSRFFANISHEFRTPLTLIKGPIESLLSKTHEEESRQDLEMMHRNSDRLLQLINQLLDLSKLETGRMSLHTSPENIVSFLKGIVLSFASLAERKKIALTFDSKDELIIVYFDRDKLQKIITNLLSNALKFTPEGGVVSVAVGSGSRDQSETATAPATANKFVDISIKDTGIGIATDRLDKIFDRFYQVDDSPTKTHGGTGIGLALTKELVELHKGGIFVESEVGKGSTFTVRLLLGKDHLEENQIISKPVGAIEDAASPVRVIEDTPDLSDIEEPHLEEKTSDEELPILLIVEDNSDVRVYIRNDLQDSYRIIEAEDGVEGLKKGLDTVPDLIISDVMMPGMDGFAMCEKLKTDERTSHIPVILLTARASGESKVTGLETGADDYLTKPFDIRELRVRIKNLIELRRKLQQRFQEQIKLQPDDVDITSMDKKFLQRALDVINQYMLDSDFSAEIFSKEMAMSRVHLNRKLSSLTGQTTTDFIRSMRLKRAAQLLERKSGSISEIAYEVGFNNLSYFANCFREQFGQLPSEYVQKYSKK